MVMCNFTQTYGDEHYLNSEKHKEEFEIQNVTVMDLSCVETQIFHDHICYYWIFHLAGFFT